MHAPQPPRRKGVWILELTGTFNQAIAKFGEGVWNALLLLEGIESQKEVEADRIQIGRLRTSLNAGIEQAPYRKDLREFLTLVEDMPEEHVIGALELRRLLEGKLTDDMRKARDIAKMQNFSNLTLRPEWAKGALVFLTIQDLGTFKGNIEELALTWQPPRRGINRVIVSEDFKPWVHSVIMKKRHVEKRGHQEGKHKCIVDETHSRVEWPYPVQPPRSAPSSVRSFGGSDTSDTRTRSTGSHAAPHWFDHGSATSSAISRRKAFQLPRFDPQRRKEWSQYQEDKFYEHFWSMNGEGMVTYAPTVGRPLLNPTGGVWAIGNELVTLGYQVTWGVLLISEAQVGLVRDFDLAWMRRKVKDGMRPRSPEKLGDGLYAAVPEGEPYNVMDGLKYGWADESDWPGIAPQGPFDENGYTGGGFLLEAGAYTLKVDLSQQEWHWFGRLTVTRDGDDPERSGRSCWVRILAEDEGVRLCIALPPQLSHDYQPQAFITRTDWNMYVPEGDEETIPPFDEQYTHMPDNFDAQRWGAEAERWGNPNAERWGHPDAERWGNADAEHWGNPDAERWGYGGDWGYGGYPVGPYGGF